MVSPPDDRVVVAVDVGGTKIAVATVDELGHCGEVATRPTPAREGADAVLAAIAGAVREVAGDQHVLAVSPDPDLGDLRRTVRHQGRDLGKDGLVQERQQGIRHLLRHLTFS